jgi:Uncharacterized protein conserved in bacteria (DUF2334)
MTTRARACYLLRFDDICPTMKWSNWESIEEILIESAIKPIMAIVPDNRDPYLQVEPANPNFWDRVRRWQSAGWTLGLHGFQHTYVTSDPGLYSNRKASEFAGLPAEVQREKLQRALAILHDQRVNSNLWIAPGHSFDRTTVSILRELGVTSISDGFSVAPYTDRDGTFWIPQQQLSEKQILSAPGLETDEPKSRGIWTVCLHPNAWSSRDISRFKHEVNRLRPLLKSTDEIYALYHGRRLNWMDRVSASKCEMRRRLRLLLEKRALVTPNPASTSEICTTLKG